MTDHATLDTLQAEAAADQPAAPVPEKMSADLPGEAGNIDPPKEPPQIAKEVADLLEFVVDGGAPMFPRTAMLYPEKTRQELGKRFEKLCIKHGWLQNGLMSDAGPEISIGFLVVPLFFATLKTVKLDLADLQGMEAQAKAPTAA